jgi:hypothetical protein
MGGKTQKTVACIMFRYTLDACIRQMITMSVE